MTPETVELGKYAIDAAFWIAAIWLAVKLISNLIIAAIAK